MTQKIRSLNDKLVPINEINTPIERTLNEIARIPHPIKKNSPTNVGLIAIPTKANK